MKKEEKTELTRERIKKAALKEFGAGGYDGVTLNSICSKYEISKGLLYHNFKGKDELYLECAAMCFNELTDCLKGSTKNANPEERLKSYFSARLHFFHSNPLYLRIFCDAVMFPPAHLTDDIKRIKRDFDSLNREALTFVIEHLNLRPDIKKEDVIETFRQYQDFINAKYQSSGIEDIDFKSHEKQCYKALNILLYGIIERKENA